MNYSKMKMEELKAICKEYTIKGITGKKKDKLIEMIQQRNATPVQHKKIDETNKTNEAIEAVEAIEAITVIKMAEINQICEFIANIKDSRIVLLRIREVIMWLFADLSFLPPIEKKNKSNDIPKYKVLEDKWGQAIMKIRRPDLKLDKQWTNKFGEHICEEIYTLLGKNVSKPVKKNHYQPDHEIDNAIIESKTGTFYTGGTAGEKILGCAFKYSEIPDLYSKPLKILCMGGAEKICREQYGNLDGSKCSIQKRKFLDFYKGIGIEYIGATDILKQLINL